MQKKNHSISSNINSKREILLRICEKQNIMAAGMFRIQTPKDDVIQFGYGSSHFEVYVVREFVFEVIFFVFLLYLYPEPLYCLSFCARRIKSARATHEKGDKVGNFPFMAHLILWCLLPIFNATREDFSSAFFSILASLSIASTAKLRSLLCSQRGSNSQSAAKHKIQPRRLRGLCTK